MREARRDAPARLIRCGAGEVFFGHEARDLLVDAALQVEAELRRVALRRHLADALLDRRVVVGEAGVAGAGHPGVGVLREGG